MTQQVEGETKEPPDRLSDGSRWQQVAVTIEQWVGTIGSGDNNRWASRQWAGMCTMRSCNNKRGVIQKTWFGVPSSKVPGSIKRYFWSKP